MAAQRVFTFNERDVAKIQRLLNEARNRPRGEPPRPATRDTAQKGHIHYFRNDSGETIPAGGIMRKTGTELVDGALTYVMNKPTTVLADPYSWFVNLGRDIPDDDHGWCSTFEDEPGLAYYLSGTIAVGDWWGPKPGQWNLERYYLGFRIDGNADNGLVVVKQHVVTQMRGVLDGTLSEGGSATVSIYAHNGSTWIDTGANVTAYDDLLETGGSLPSTTVVNVYFNSGRWWVQEARCSA